MVQRRTSTCKVVLEEDPQGGTKETPSLEAYMQEGVVSKK